MFKKLCSFAILSFMAVSSFLAAGIEQEINGIVTLRMKENQVIAKFFNFRLYSGDLQNVPDGKSQLLPSNNLQGGFTKILTYRIDEEDCQIGWYADGYVITFLNGKTKGKQIVVWKDNVVGVSYPDKKQKKPDADIVHAYSWGYVFTKHDRQSVFISSIYDFINSIDKDIK